MGVGRPPRRRCKVVRREDSETPTLHDVPKSDAPLRVDGEGVSPVVEELAPREPNATFNHVIGRGAKGCGLRRRFALEVLSTSGVGCLRLGVVADRFGEALGADLGSRSPGGRRVVGDGDDGGGVEGIDGGGIFRVSGAGGEIGVVGRGEGHEGVVRYFREGWGYGLGYGGGGLSGMRAGSSVAIDR